ncbi:LysR family transcriptional regulator [Actinopolymorpha sp. B11F2]|uniref:LysR family transcriptional regulator n=1 Tax=Actinopolymorpha sp. B11F2 TaxID=3160862 RepID=UPI0032E4EEE3
MEVYQLRAFVEVAADMHVGRAAARLHMAQPTLSRQIAALERDLGVPLFSRARRRIALTPAGEIFLGKAREILGQLDVAAEDARRAARGEIGTLRLGFVQSATYAAVPRLVGRFRAVCPEVRLEAGFMTTMRQIPALQAGLLDVGLLRPQQPANAYSGLHTRVISRDAMVAVLPARHPLAVKRRISLAELAGEAFVVYHREEGSTGYEAIIDHCRGAGFTPRIVQEAGDAQTIVALVGANLGVSLMLGPTPNVDPGLVTYRPLSDRIPTWDMALAWSVDNRSATLERFLAIATELTAGGAQVGSS